MTTTSASSITSDMGLVGFYHPWHDAFGDEVEDFIFSFMYDAMNELMIML
jgi:hypothetical protein